MNLHDMNELRYIDMEIKGYKDKILELRAMAESMTANLSGMPHGGGNGGSKVERAAVAIVDYQKMIEDALCKRIEKSKKIHEYILGIDDAQTRQIAYLRFVQSKSWGEVAKEIGGYNAPSTVRSRIIRYIEKEEKEHGEK